MPTPTTTFVVTSSDLDWVLAALMPTEGATWEANGITLRLSMPLAEVPAFRQALVEEVQHQIKMRRKPDPLLLDFVNYVFAQTTDWDVLQVAAHVGVTIEDWLGM